MSQLQVRHGEMSKAANAAQTAAADAKGHGSSEALGGVAAALPNATAVSHLGDLGRSWDDEVASWVRDTNDFGSDLAAAGEDYRSADAGAGGLFGGLLGGG